MKWRILLYTLLALFFLGAIVPVVTVLVDPRSGRQGLATLQVSLLSEASRSTRGTHPGGTHPDGTLTDPVCTDRSLDEQCGRRRPQS